MKTFKVYIEDYPDFNVKNMRVLSDLEHGQKLRDELFLDRLDDLIEFNESVEIIIPKYIFTMTQSFYNGLFTKSVHKLGAEKFKKYYILTFENTNIDENKIAPKYMLDRIVSNLQNTTTAKKVDELNLSFKELMWEIGKFLRFDKFLKWLSDKLK